MSEGTSEYGFNEKQAKVLEALLQPFLLEVAALRNLLLAKGLLTREELEAEARGLDVAAILRQMEQDIRKDKPNTDR